MKKLSLLVGGLVLSTMAMAQKPSAADAAITVEGQLGYNAASFSFQAPSVRARYFFTDNIAARVTFGINNSSTSDIAYEDITDPANANSGTYKSTNNGWNLGIGGEYHFTGTDRLSPYVGLDILLGGAKQTADGDHVDGTNTYAADQSYTGEKKSSMFGVNLVAGTDYYFAENFYLGFELGIGWSTWKDQEGSYTSTVAGTSTTVKTNAEHKQGALANNAIGLFRLGWRF